MLAVLWRGRSVVEVLATPVDELGELAGAGGWLGRTRSVLMEVGLEHLALGRRTTTLSGGETRRLALAAGLIAGEDVALFLLEQPGRGPSSADLSGVLTALGKRAAKGGALRGDGRSRRLRAAASEIQSVE